MWDRLPDIKSAFLLVDGTLDAPVPPVNAQLIGARLPGSKVLWFENWGHGLVVGEAGQRLAQATADFLAGKEPEGAFAVAPNGEPLVTEAGGASGAPAPQAPAAGAAGRAGATAAALLAALAAAALVA